jgi:hypothetical protein
MSVPAPDSEWFFLPLLVAFWLAICGVLSLMSGWYELSQRFKSSEHIDGERFSLRSGAIGWGVFPVSYGNCLFVTVGPEGIGLSILFPFRFLHPRLLMPWAAIERCEAVRFLFMEHVAVHVWGFNRRLLFRGAVGKRILATWAQAGRGR